MRHVRYRFTPEEEREEMEQSLLTYTRVYGPYAGMRHALGRLKSSERQRMMLIRGRIACHCIGGISMHDRDLQKLIKRGYMKFIRVPYAKGWGGDYPLSRTYAVITEKGKAAFRNY